MNKEERQRALNREYQRRYREKHGQAWKDYYAKWRAEHPEKLQEYSKTFYAKHRAHLLRRQREVKLWCLSIAALNGGRVCKRCGEDDPVVLEFHHRDPATKGFTIASVVRDIPKPEDAAMVMAEIAKCDVLCANCHRRVHWVAVE